MNQRYRLFKWSWGTFYVEDIKSGKQEIRPDKGKARGIWDRRAALIKSRGPLTEDLTLPARSKQTWRNPLDD